MERKAAKSQEIDMLIWDFSMRHKMTPEMAEVARATVKQNLMMVDKLFSNGLVTQKQVAAAFKDEEVLSEFADMMEAQEKGIHDAFKLLFDDIKDHPVLFCSWLLFENEVLEKKSGLLLTPKTENDYKYEDFLGLTY